MASFDTDSFSSDAFSSDSFDLEPDAPGRIRGTCAGSSTATATLTYVSTLSAAGWLWGGKKKKKLTVLIDGKRMKLSQQELADLLTIKAQEAEQEAEQEAQKASQSATEAPVKAPTVEVKVVTQDVPDYVSEAIQREVARTNAIIARIWTAAMIQRIQQLQEEDDEECLLLCL